MLSLFDEMEYSEDFAQIREWAPLLERADEEPLQRLGSSLERI